MLILDASCLSSCILVTLRCVVAWGPSWMSSEDFFLDLGWLGGWLVRFPSRTFLFYRMAYPLVRVEFYPN